MATFIIILWFSVSLVGCFVLLLRYLHGEFTKLGELMADIQDTLDQVNAATNTLSVNVASTGARVTALIASIQAAGQTLTDAQSTEAANIVTTLTNASTDLSAIAASSNNPPAPVTPPVVTTLPPVSTV